MKAGDLVELQGTMWSSYGREGEVGILIDTKLLTNRNGYPAEEFSQVLWGDGEAKLYKTEHLEVISESR